MKDLQLHDFGYSDEKLESKYTLDEIRGRISWMINDDKKGGGYDQKQLAVLELILCLSNEIEILKSKK
jgi:hypothetical protein